MKKKFNCLNCDKECEADTSQSKCLYCSNQCQRDYQHKQKVLEWLDGGEVGEKTIKRYLVEKNNSCWSCGIKDWNSKSIVFELEHMDGDSRNNNESNLCLLCPNCHSQTDTYKGKNRGKGRYARRERYAAGKSY